MQRKIMLIVPPCGPDPTSYPPYGALCIGTILQNNGHLVEVLNLDRVRRDLDEVVREIKKYGPDIIGFSAVVSNSYRYIKEYTRVIKENFPEVFLILGGQLSYAAKVVLQNTPIDAIVIGEGENTVLSLCKYLDKETSLGEINGIAYKNKNDEVIFTGPVKQIKNLDDLPIPDYSLIEMDNYLLTADERYGEFFFNDPRFNEPHRKDKKAFTIMTGRGCQAKCTFCCRGVQGLRKHSPEYLLDLMEDLIDNYNVGYFTFGDESFIASKKWVLNFLKALKERKLDVLFYVLGARVDLMDRELIFALKDAGCFMIEYGYESGCQRMLDLIEKRTTVSQNYKAHMLTMKEAGLFTVPAFIINMPGETSETIAETIQFVKSLELDDVSFVVKYAQAQPGTPLYEFALLKEMITDEDAYLDNLNEIHPGDLEGAYKRKVLFNFSGQPLEEVFAWESWMYDAIRKDIIKRKHKKVSRSKFVKPGEYFDIAEKSFKDVLRVFLRKENKKVKLFGTNWSLSYLAPVKIHVKRATLRRLTRKYLGDTPENSALMDFIKNSADDDLAIRQLRKPVRRLTSGARIQPDEPKLREEVPNDTGNDMHLFLEKAGKYRINRYESLRVVCDEIETKKSKDDDNYKPLTHVGQLVTF